MASIAWPLVSLVAFVIFVLVFRRELRLLLPRVTSIGLQGVTTSPAGQSGDAPQALDAARELLKLPSTPILLAREDQVRTHLAAKHLPKSEDREAVLIRYFAAAWLHNDLDWIYMRILGSQLGALQFLNAQRFTPLAAIRVWYDQAASRDPDAYSGFNFHQWMTFFFLQNLAEQSADVVTITEFGREFLRHVITRGLPIVKPY